MHACTRPLFLAALALLLAACGGPGPDCRVGADCASGICLSNGTCAPDGADGQDAFDGDDGGPSDGDQDPDGDDPADGGDDPLDGDEGPADGDAQGGDDGGTNTCVPVVDGVIERDEVPFAPGVHATFAVSGLTDVDTAGEVQADDSRIWDLSGEFDGDHQVLVTLGDLVGEWFAPDFAGATYHTRLRDDEDLLGVFEATDDALLLRGVVSPEDGLTKTLLSFDPPVTVLSFPIQLGHTWTTAATVSGQALGVWSYYFEDYDSQVDAQGTLHTPFGAFPVFRVRTVMTRTVGMVVTRVRTFMFVTECFGTVAVIHSRDNETAEEFTRAAEVRRLAP